MAERFSVRIEGMTCQACASRLERVLQKKGFSDASVSFASEMLVTHLSEAYMEDEVLRLIEQAGFKGVKEEKKETADKGLGFRRGVLFAIAFVFLFAMPWMFFGRHLLPLWLQFILASVVQFGLATTFYKSAWASVRGGVANMDVLVSVATLVIYVYSSVAYWFFSSHAVYFEAGVMILAFVSLGKWIEARVKRESLDDMGALLRLMPPQAEVWRDESWQSVAVGDLKKGERIRAKLGDRLPADGLVLSGKAWLNVAHLTGESEPVLLETGGVARAGAYVLEGSIELRADGLGKESLLGEMVEAFAQAQGSKAPIARLADRISAVFVPGVLVFAVLTVILTFVFLGDFSKALLHGVAVLVIACPCALGLATPAAIMVGVGEAVRRGVFFKDAQALEAVAKVDRVVFDKTGTLTEGAPKLIDYVLAEGADFDEALRLLASLEVHANHPLAKALVALNVRPLFSVQNVQNTIGAGISGEVLGVGEVRVGKLEFCDGEAPKDWVGSVVALSLNGVWMASFLLRDALKEDAKATVKRLQKLHKEVVLLSGDKEAVVKQVAEELGLNEALFEQSPKDKQDYIFSRQEKGEKVAMVGDGINDAPAMALADAALAMHSGANLTQESADATLMHNQSGQVVDALFVAQRTYRTIKENLFFAFFYNVAAIPLAALGFLSPMLAAMAMALSSLSVLLNALRLRFVIRRALFNE